MTKERKRGRGRPPKANPPKPGGAFTIKHIPPDLWPHIKAGAALARMNLSEFILATMAEKVGKK